MMRRRREVSLLLRPLLANALTCGAYIAKSADSADRVNRMVGRCE